jgi:hypothetical protein
VFGLQILDIALGMIFVYLLLSLAVTAGTEVISGVFHLRAKTLIEGVEKLLHDPAIAKQFFAHPLVRSLEIRGRKPSYIPAETFRLAIGNILAGEGTVKSIDEAQTAVHNLPEDSELRKVLLILIDEAENDFRMLQENVETLFNNSMNRVSGWYKSKAQTITFFVALVIACVSNADTIQITRSLANDPALRDALVAQAQEYAKQDVPPTAGVDETIRGMKDLGVPLGWKGPPDNWLEKIVGLLLSTLAMTFGAPFWFDLLKKVVNIRSSGSLRAAADSVEPVPVKT